LQPTEGLSPRGKEAMAVKKKKVYIIGTEPEHRFTFAKDGSSTIAPEKKGRGFFLQSTHVSAKKEK